MNTGTYPSFDVVWEEYMVPLVGKTVYTLARGKKNVITKVDQAGIVRISCNEEVSTVDIDVIRWTYKQLVKRGNLTKDEIHNYQPSLRASSIICSILATVPFISVTLKPQTTLYLIS